MPEANDPATIAADTEAISATMPFTQLIRDSEAKQAEYLRDHPEMAPKEPQTPFSETELGKVIIDTEHKVAEDYAAGRITQEEFNDFSAKSQHMVDDYQKDLGGAVNDLGDAAKDWVGDVKDLAHNFTTDHPELAGKVPGDATLVEAADAIHLVGEVVHPVINIALDGVDNIIEVAKTDLPDAAHNLVEARGEMHGVNPNEVQALEVRVDTASADFTTKMDTAQQSLHDAHDKVDADFDKFNDGVEQLREYGQAHPEATITGHTDLTDHQLQEQQVHETGVTDA